MYRNVIKKKYIFFMIIISINTILLLNAFEYPYNIDTHKDKDYNNPNNIIKKIENILTNKPDDRDLINQTKEIRTITGDFTLLSLLLLYPESSELSYHLANSLLVNKAFSQKSKQATIFNIIMLSTSSKYKNNKNIEEMLKILLNHGGQLPVDKDGTDYNLTNLKKIFMIRGQKIPKNYLDLVKNNSKIDNSLFFGSDGKAKSKDDSDVKFFEPQKKSESNNNESSTKNNLTLFAQALKNIAG